MYVFLFQRYLAHDLKSGPPCEYRQPSVTEWHSACPRRSVTAIEPERLAMPRIVTRI